MTDQEAEAISRRADEKESAMSDVRAILYRRDQIRFAISSAERGDGIFIHRGFAWEFPLKNDKDETRPYLRISGGDPLGKKLLAAVLPVLRERLAALDDELATKAQSL